MYQIRPATSADADGVLDVYRPVVEKTPISFEFKPPSRSEIEARIDGVLAFYPWLVCERNGEVMGYAYATRFRAREAYLWSVETAIYVHQDRRARGVGRALYTALLETVNAQGFAMAYAGITLPNPASVGFHESFGFEKVGVFSAVGNKGGVWHDVGFWQLELSTSTAEPDPPVPFPTFRTTPAFERAIKTAMGCFER